MSDDIICIESLAKRYQSVEALRGLSLAVPRGSVCGFLGRNGAGKTTTIKILLGMVRRDSGSARVFGLDASNRAANVAIRRRTAFVSETKELYPYMTVEDFLRFTRGFFPGWRDDLAEKYRQAFALPLDRTIPKLSKGMQSKLMLLAALARGAELLILDEPTDGMDPEAVEEALQAIVAVAAEQETTVFFSSHQLSEVEQIADRVSIIDSGATVLNEQLDDLRANYRTVQLVFDGDPPGAALNVPGVERMHTSGRMLSLLVSRDVDGIVERARSQQAVSIDVRPVTLKEIFLGAIKAKI